MSLFDLYQCEYSMKCIPDPQESPSYCSLVHFKVHPLRNQYVLSQTVSLGFSVIASRAFFLASLSHNPRSSEKKEKLDSQLINYWISPRKLLLSMLLGQHPIVKFPGSSSADSTFNTWKHKVTKRRCLSVTNILVSLYLRVDLVIKYLCISV